MNTAKNLQTRASSPLTARLRVVQTQASAQESGGHALETGIVAAAEQGAYSVRLEHHEVTAARAAGCLLAPEVGDRVLLLRETSGQCFVLHVLVKARPDSRLAFKGKVRLEGEELELCGARRLQLQGAEVELQGVQGNVSFLKLDVAARDLRARIKSIHAVAARMTQRLGSCLRLVGRERIQARRLDARVEKRWSVAAGDLELTAQKDVKVDGEQILLG